MSIRKLIRYSLSHVFVGLIGFVLGIYTLPILTAPKAPSVSTLEKLSTASVYRTTFKRDLQDSDFLHWGDGEVALSAKFITLQGELAPGPDYRLYLSPKFVETEMSFNRLKASMVEVGDVRTFNNFMVEIPANIDIAQYTTVIVWCETFGEFITSAQYR